MTLFNNIILYNIEDYIEVEKSVKKKISRNKKEGENSLFISSKQHIKVS